jgi:hypothetical protein
MAVFPVMAIAGLVFFLLFVSPLESPSSTDDYANVVFGVS